MAESFVTVDTLQLGPKCFLCATDVLTEPQAGVKQWVALLTGLDPAYGFARTYCKKAVIPASGLVEYTLRGPGLYEFRGLVSGRQKYEGFFVATDRGVALLDRGGVKYRLGAPKGE